MKHSGICIVSLLGGMIVGSALTMLLTPQSGPDLRASIKDYVEKEIEKVRCKCNEENRDEE
ncbi:MAG: YtxH domain-containing protein [Alistipes sp.]